MSRRKELCEDMDEVEGDHGEVMMSTRTIGKLVGFRACSEFTSILNKVVAIGHRVFYICH